MGGDDKGESWHNMRISPAVQKKVPFDVQKEKWVFLEAHNEFVDRNCALTFVVPLVFNEGLVFVMPLSFDRLIPKKLTGRESILKNFLKSCLALV